jgi:hypothetical protein
MRFGQTQPGLGGRLDVSASSRLCAVGDPAQALQLAVPLAAGALALLALSYSMSVAVLLEVLIGAAAGLQLVQVAGRLHVLTILCVVYFVICGHRIQHRLGRSIALLGCVGVLTLSVPMGSLVVTNTLALQLLGFALVAVIIALTASERSITHMLYGLLFVCTAAACVSIGQRLGILPYTYDTLITDGFARPNGFYTEPDWLGLYSAVGLVIAFRIHIPRTLKVITVVALASGLLFSLARSAWLALAVVCVLIVLGLVFSRARGRRETRTLRVAAGTAVIGIAAMVGLAVLSPSFVTTVQERVTTTGSRSDGATTGRLAQHRSLDQLAATAPWHGYGLSAAGRVDAISGFISYGETTLPNTVVTNWILGWWVDGKYLAIPLIGFLIWLALANVRRTSGLLLILILVSSMFANAIYLPITWFAVGLGLAQLPTPSRGPVVARPRRKTQQASAPRLAGSGLEGP